MTIHEAGWLLACHSFFSRLACPRDGMFSHWLFVKVLCLRWPLSPLRVPHKDPPLSSVSSLTPRQPAVLDTMSAITLEWLIFSGKYFHKKSQRNLQDFVVDPYLIYYVTCLFYLLPFTIISDTVFKLVENSRLLIGTVFDDPHLSHH